MGYRGGIKGREKEWNNELRMKCVVGTTNQVDLGKERRQSMKDIMGVWRGVSITWGITSEANWTQPQITNAGDWLVGQERRMNGRRNASWSVIGWVDDIVILWNEQKREYLLCVIHIDYEGVEWRMMEWDMWRTIRLAGLNQIESRVKQKTGRKDGFLLSFE